MNSSLLFSCPWVNILVYIVGMRVPLVTYITVIYRLILANYGKLTLAVERQKALQKIILKKIEKIKWEAYHKFKNTLC